jgi:hypothetical protein
VTLVRERPPLVGEVSANFCGYRGATWSVRRIPYGRNLGFLDHNNDNNNCYFPMSSLSLVILQTVLSPARGATAQSV